VVLHDGLAEGEAHPHPRALAADEGLEHLIEAGRVESGSRVAHPHRTSPQRGEPSRSVIVRLSAGSPSTASSAFRRRFSTTCWIWTGSPATSGSPSRRFLHQPRLAQEHLAAEAGRPPPPPSRSDRADGARARPSSARERILWTTSLALRPSETNVLERAVHLASCPARRGRGCEGRPERCEDPRQGLVHLVGDGRRQKAHALHPPEWARDARARSDSASAARCSVTSREVPIIAHGPALPGRTRSSPGPGSCAPLRPASQILYSAWYPEPGSHGRRSTVSLTCLPVLRVTHSFEPTRRR